MSTKTKKTKAAAKLITIGFLRSNIGSIDVTLYPDAVDMQNALLLEKLARALTGDLVRRGSVEQQERLVGRIESGMDVIGRLAKLNPYRSSGSKYAAVWEEANDLLSNFAREAALEVVVDG